MSLAWAAFARQRMLRASALLACPSEGPGRALTAGWWARVAVLGLARSVVSSSSGSSCEPLSIFVFLTGPSGPG
eukprot:14405585-Alexandrium_andersonii.AAC.1